MATESATTVGETDLVTPERSRVLSGVVHLLGLVTFVVGPLVVLWASRDEFVQENARHALNWQLTVVLAINVSVLLYGLTLLSGDGHPILWASVVVVSVLGATVLFCCVAVLHALRGTVWEYPLAFRIVETTRISRTF